MNDSVNEYSIPIRTLICAYNMFDYCKDKYPLREVQPDKHCPNNEFCYFNRKSRNVRVVRNKKEIWICDHEKGYPYMKRVK